MGGNLQPRAGVTAVLDIFRRIQQSPSRRFAYLERCPSRPKRSGWWSKGLFSRLVQSFRLNEAARGRLAGRFRRKLRVTDADTYATIGQLEST
jgi:hypothetical protein